MAEQESGGSPESSNAQPQTQQNTGGKRKTLTITIKDQSVLYAAYMPFFRNGGLFVPTRKAFAMSEECNLSILLPGVDEPFIVKGKVAWITPVGGQGNHTPGIGIEFAENVEGEMLRRKIEEILGPLLQSGGNTHTM